jgi:FkbM family methyltransferase
MNAHGRLRRKYQAVRWSVKNWLHSQLLQRLDLERNLETGIHVKISNFADWTIYNDIFVEGEYDLAIRTALESRGNGNAFRVIDLGANVGFFAMRLYHLLALSPTAPEDVGLTCIEGSPTIYRELVRRVTLSPALNRGTKLVHGLVGKLHGSGLLVDSGFHPMTSLHSHRSSSGVRVPFVDLNQFFQDDEPISLVKCDIEGSECDFIESYPNLLRRTHVAVFELHHDKCDRFVCQERLQSLGFKRASVLKEDTHSSLELFRNDSIGQGSNRQITA